MKSVLFIIFSFVLTFSVMAQEASKSTPAKSEKAVKTVSTAKDTKISSEGEREKFDPLRDPAADLKIAVESAQKTRKRIILDVGGEWCVWCRIMDFYLISKPSIAKIRDDNYIWLKINMSLENENKSFLSAYPEIKGYPHLFVLESDGTFLHSQETSPLETESSYDDAKFTEFLTTWIAPKPNAIP